MEIEPPPQPNARDKRTIPVWGWLLIAFVAVGIMYFIILRHGAGDKDLYPLVHYWATTDTEGEMEELATASEALKIKCKLSDAPFKGLHIASVTGGMSGLSLVLNFVEHCRIASITFYDYKLKLTLMARLYIALLKICPTRADFLQRFYARDANDGRNDASKITTQTMTALFYDSPFKEDVFSETVKLLEHTDSLAAKLYEEEMRDAIGEAKRSGHVPRMWPCWSEDLQKKADPKFGIVRGDPLSPLKTSTLWHNQAGFMKTEERYTKLRDAVRVPDITFKYVEIDLNQADMSVIASPIPDEVSDVMIFTSNALSLSKWVKDGDDKESVAKRFRTAFPDGGTVFETCSAQKITTWSFTDKAVNTSSMAYSASSASYPLVRYWATTDSEAEVEELATVSEVLNVKCRTTPCEKLHIASVTGGMSGLSLISDFASQDISISSITFFDYKLKIVTMAKLYIALIKICETRAKFLQSFYARDAKDGRSDVGTVTIETMSKLFYDSLFSEDVFSDTEAKLEGLDVDAAELYRNEMREAIPEAKARNHVPRAWPCWSVDLQSLEDHKFGIVWGEPTDPLKTSTLWVNQGGFMKTEERYKKLREALLSGIEMNYVELDLNQPDMSVLAPPSPDNVKDVMIFTSNALGASKWVKDGTNRESVAKRFRTAFPDGGTVFETRSFTSQKVGMWSFTNDTVDRRLQVFV